MPCMLGNTSNIAMREQCHPEAEGGYVRPVAQHTGQHLLSCMSPTLPNPTPPHCTPLPFFFNWGEKYLNEAYTI